MMKNAHIDVDHESGSWIEMRDDKVTLEFVVKESHYGEMIRFNLTPEQVKELRDDLSVFLKEHK